VLVWGVFSYEKGSDRESLFFFFVALVRRGYRVACCHELGFTFKL
jgi:hypothetical protein